MPSIVLFYAFLVALLTVLLMIPSISRLAVSIGILDRCDEERKIHTDDIPRLGGFAIFFAFTLSAILICSFDMTAKGMLAGGIIIFLTGLADDLTGLTPRQKFAGQFIAVGVSVLIGERYVTTLGDLFGFGEIDLGNAAIPFTMIAIVGVINAINLLDGLDGLAAGTAGIVAICFSILAYHTGNEPLLVMLVCFLGAVFGFLKFNTFPAQIFMGDSGSLFLGYCLGNFAVMLVTASSGNISPMTPVMVLIIPIFDTLYVMAKRAFSRQKLFVPDKRHLHHRLLGLRFKHQVVVTVLYGLSYLLGFVALFTHEAPTYLLFYGLVGVCALLYLGLGVVEQSEQFQTVGAYHFRISLFPERQRQRLHTFSGKLDDLLKYLLLFIIISSAIIPLPDRNQIVLVATFMLLLSQGLIFLSDNVGNRYLLFLLFVNLTYIIYYTENNFRSFEIAGLPFRALSGVLFILLFAMVLFKLIIKGSPLSLLDTPLEYLILFLAISVPLIPQPFQGEHHLLVVSGKSMILFMAYKLLLKSHQDRQNRMFVMLTFLALSYVVIRGFI
jgi:UDP-GlcNAc:undecaprenyl-phosphate GlcNAc-1-phosphate transferase